jgi:hypothetical protein
LEAGPPPYYRRYVCRRFGEVESCFSIGTRDPFVGRRTPIWLRFHDRTGRFAEIRRNLESAGLMAGRHGERGHLWFPLNVPIGSGRDSMIEALAAQVERITSAAYALLPPLDA